MQKYEQNREEIARLEKIQNEADEAFKKMRAEHEAKKEELFNAIKYLKRQNHKIAEKNYTFSLGEILEETKKVAKSYGFCAPVFSVNVSTTIWNTGKSYALAKSVKDCRNWLENCENRAYLEDAVVRVNIENFNYNRAKEYWFSFSKKLDFDMLMCDGSKLIDNLYSQVDFDDVQGYYNTKLLLKEDSKREFPLIIDPTNYPNCSLDVFNNEFVADVFANLMAKREQEAEKTENNR